MVSPCFFPGLGGVRMHDDVRKHDLSAVRVSSLSAAAASACRLSMSKDALLILLLALDILP